MSIDIKEILSLTRDEQKHLLAEASLEDLQKFAPELTALATEKGYQIPDALSKENFRLRLVKGQLQQQLIGLLKQFPAVVDTRLALDREFDDPKDKMNTIVDDLNQGRIPISRYWEFLHHNYFEKEETEGVLKSRTFIAYTLPKIKDSSRLYVFLQPLQKQLGNRQFQLYLDTPNFLDAETKVSVGDLYLKDYGFKNSEEREALKLKDTEFQDTFKEYIQEQNLAYVRFDNVDTHNVSSHKTGDESHVTAFRMMLEANSQLKVKAQYTKSLKESDPSREVRIESRGDLDAFIQNELKAFQVMVNSLIAMSDADLYNNYLRYNDAEKFKGIEYTELGGSDKESFDKKIQGWRFKAGAAKRYMDNMINNHRCDSGTYRYNTNDKATCGLTMEEMVATAHWASRDKVNFKSPEVTEKGNFLSLIDQLYDMRRGYDIDHGTDKPEEWKFPDNPGTDNNRCHGGGVNSLSWSLNASHKAYNPKKIERSDVERELKQIYKKIINDNIDYIKNIPQEILKVWSSSNKVTGELRKYLTDFFNTKELKAFEEDYKGYIADDTFYSVVEQGLDNIEIPDNLKQSFAIEKMSQEALYDMIANGVLPILHLDKEEGYETTLNYLRHLAGKEDLIKFIFDKAIANAKEPSNRNVLVFLSRSNLDEATKDLEVLKIREKPIKLRDIAILSPTEMEALYTKEPQDLLEFAIERNYSSLFELYYLKVGLTEEELGGRYGAWQRTPLHYAVESCNAEVVKALLEAAGDKKMELLQAKDSSGQTPLHSAAAKGNLEVVKALLEAAGERKMELLQAKSYLSRTPLHSAAENGKLEVVKALLEAAGDKKMELLQVRDNFSQTPLHSAAANNLEVVKALLEAAGDKKMELLQAKDKWNQTPLYRAAENGNLEVVKALLEAAGDKKMELLQVRDNFSRTPLHRAAAKGNLEVVKALLEAAGDKKMELLQAQDYQGETPLRNIIQIYQQQNIDMSQIFDIFVIRFSAELGEVGSEIRANREKEVRKTVGQYLMQYAVSNDRSTRDGDSYAARVTNTAAAISPKVVQEEIDRILGEIVPGYSAEKGNSR